MGVSVGGLKSKEGGYGRVVSVGWGRGGEENLREDE